MPDEPEVHGLLAMMLLLDARREARFRGGDLVLLADQDRSLWDTALIADGRALLDRALAPHGLVHDDAELRLLERRLAELGRAPAPS
jgi:RNA polymerase sigma-70 factor, ECF subfamily